jgi:oligo-1,6-glucosidase
MQILVMRNADQTSYASGSSVVLVVSECKNFLFSSSYHTYTTRDVINLISKVPGYPDGEVVDPGHEYQPGFKHYANGPKLHQYLKEMNRTVLSKYDCMTVGEMPFIRENSEILKAVGAQEEELNMIFIFELVDIDNVPNTYRMTLRDWKPKEIKECINRWQRLMIDNDGWNSLFIENHDNPRSVSRYTDDSDATRELGAKLIALMQTTLCGTLYVYQGEEIGMRNAPPSWEPTEYLDIESQNYWKKMSSQHSGDEKMLKHARNVLQVKARDHARTPVQWTPGANAGFCADGVKPWMRVNDDWETCNAETERATPASDSRISTWQFWQRGLQSRKEHKDVFV